MQPSPTISSMPSYAARSRGSLLRISASVLLSAYFLRKTHSIMTNCKFVIGSKTLMTTSLWIVP